MRSATTNATASATAHDAKAIVKPRSVGSPVDASVAVTIPAETWLPIAPPMVRTIVFIPVATPVWVTSTDSMIRFAIEAKANPIPTPITSIAT